MAEDNINMYTKLDGDNLPVDYCQILLRRKHRGGMEAESATYKAYDYAVGMLYQIGAKKWEFFGGDDDGHIVRCTRPNLPGDWDEYMYIGGKGDKA